MSIFSIATARRVRCVRSSTPGELVAIAGLFSLHSTRRGRQQVRAKGQLTGVISCVGRSSIRPSCLFVVASFCLVQQRWSKRRASPPAARPAACSSGTGSSRDGSDGAARIALISERAAAAAATTIAGSAGRTSPHRLFRPCRLLQQRQQRSCDGDSNCCLDVIRGQQRRSTVAA